MSIFSSYRNNNWIILESTDFNFLYDIADDLLLNFFRCFFSDVSDVQKRRESGWQYNKLISVSIVNLKRDAPMLAYGSFSRNRKVNPHLRTAFLRNVFLFDNYFRHDKKNPVCCVPACIISKLEYMAVGQISVLKKRVKRIRKLSYLIVYKELLSRGSNDVLLTDFPKLEQLNHPFPSGLVKEYPYLNCYRGFALNVFKIFGCKNKYYLHCKHLSPNWNNREYLNIDFLENGPVLWEKTQENQLPLSNHVMPLLNHAGLLISFQKHVQGRNMRLKNHACRRCGTILTYHDYITHIGQCHAGPKGLINRKVANTIIHKPFTYSKIRDRHERRTLKFENRNYYKTFPPLVFGCADFECGSADIKDDLKGAGIPKNSVAVQKAIGFSIGFSTFYTNVTLPASLKNIYTKFIDDRSCDVDALYQDFLFRLRYYVLESYKFLRSVLSQDKGPPDLRNLPLEDRILHILATNCTFCGRRFDKNVKKVRHHNHFISEPNLVKKGKSKKIVTLCSACNINTQQDGMLRQSSLIVSIHNASFYDFQLVLDAVCRLGAMKFSQIDAFGRKRIFPLLQRAPNVLFKGASQILSIDLQFSCPILVSCPFHSRSAKDRPKRVYCPFQRKVSLRDSCLHIPNSLDDLINDMRNNKINSNRHLKQYFPSTYSYICEQMGHSQSTFELIAEGKCPQPFEKLKNVKYALSHKTPPPRNHFYSRLKGDHLTERNNRNEGGITDEEYKRFCDIFYSIKANNYFDMLNLYCGTDCAFLLDVCFFYYSYLYGLCGLSPIYYLTSASYALDVALFNSTTPPLYKRPLQIPILDESIYDLYSKSLIGGFSFTNANHCFFRSLEIEDGEVDIDHIRQFFFIDVNALYLSQLSQHQPFSHHTLFNAERRPNEFKEVCRHLYDVDIDFFSAELHENNHMYFFEVELDFHERAQFSPVNFDLSLFPFYETASLDDLTNEQRRQAKRLNRDPSKELPKLTSYLKHNHRTTNYVENLLYLVGFHDVKIVNIFSFIRCKAYPFFNPWLTILQNQRTLDISPVTSKVLKNLGNSLCGRLHMNISNLLSTKLCISRRLFQKYTLMDNFFNFVYINNNASLITFDGHCRTTNNVPAISSRVYSLRQAKQQKK